MTTLYGANWTGTPLDQIPKADRYVRCLFTRQEAFDDAGEMKGHRLFPGDDTPRIFEDCGLQNIEPPPGSTIVGRGRFDVISTAVAFTDEITVDGEVVSSEDFYDSTYHGTWDTATDSYDRTGAPSTAPVDYTP